MWSHWQQRFVLQCIWASFKFTLYFSDRFGNSTVTQTCGCRAVSSHQAFPPDAAGAVGCRLTSVSCLSLHVLHPYVPHKVKTFNSCGIPWKWELWQQTQHSWEIPAQAVPPTPCGAAHLCVEAAAAIWAIKVCMCEKKAPEHLQLAEMVKNFIVNAGETEIKGLKKRFTARQWAQRSGYFQFRNSWSPRCTTCICRSEQRSGQVNVLL